MYIIALKLLWYENPITNNNDWENGRLELNRNSWIIALI